MKPTERRVLRRMSQQYGAVSRTQALTLGMTAHEVDHRRQTGEWLDLYRGVYASAAHRPSFEQAIMAACLSTGGCAWGRSAAALWKLRGLEKTSQISVAIPVHRRRRSPGVDVTRIGLHRADATVLGPVPIGSPGRTLLWIAANEPGRLEPALNDVLYRRLTQAVHIRSVLARARGPAATGAALLARTLDKLAAPTESTLEDDFVALLRRHGLPEPVRQHPIAGGAYRLDFVLAGTIHAVETHGWRHHSSPGDRQADRAKRRAAKAEGWVVHDVYWEDVHEWGAETAAWLGELLTGTVLGRTA